MNMNEFEPKAIISRIKEILITPTKFFENIKEQTDYKRPLVFAIIVNILAIIITVVYQVSFQAVFFSITNIATYIGGTVPVNMFLTPLYTIILIPIVVFIMPIFIVVSLFIKSVNYHIGIKLFAKDSSLYVKTFRVVCYSTGAQVITLIPFLGALIAIIWIIVLNIIGLKIVHNTTYARAALAVFLPLILCCGFLILFVSVVFGGMITHLILR